MTTPGMYDEYSTEMLKNIIRAKGTCNRTSPEGCRIYFILDHKRIYTTNRCPLYLLAKCKIGTTREDKYSIAKTLCYTFGIDILDIVL